MHKTSVEKMLELEFHDLGLDSDLLLTSGKPVWYPQFLIDSFCKQKHFTYPSAKQKDSNLFKSLLTLVIFCF